MRSKIIKKALRIFLYFIGALLFLFISFYYTLRSPAFQTWATNRIGGYFSGKWGTTVRVEGVDIELWKKVVIEGVYIEDQHRDTLLYAKKLKLDIGKFDSDSQNVFISNVIIKDAVFKLKKYKNDSVMNLQFIIDEFASTDTTHGKKSKWNIGIGGITLNNIRFIHKIESDTITHPGTINFSDMLVSSVYGEISNIKFDADTICCTVENLSAHEKSGFYLKEFYAKASVSSVSLRADQLKIISNNSQIFANVVFKYHHYDDFNNFIDSVKVKAQFNSSNIEMADIAYFAYGLYGIRKRVFLNGNVHGKISNLKGKNILLVVGDETSFMGNFIMTGLPDINQTYMNFDAEELRTSKKGIETIPLPPFSEHHLLNIPENISLLGIIKFKGNFSGFYNDFVSYGSFKTDIGQISTDISMKEDTVTHKENYSGKFSCADFNVGKFFENEKYFGKITMNVDIDGEGLKKENANLSMDGGVSDFECKGYNYKNISVKGKFAKDIFDGSLVIKDENADIDFNGNLDFSKSPTQLNFNSTIAKANLSKLNITNPEDSVSVSAKIEINAIGNNADDVIGKMKLNNVVYVKKAKAYDFKDISFSIEDENGTKTVSLNSDIIDAKIYGKLKPLEVIPSIKDFLGDYLPSVFPKDQVVLNKKNPRKQKNQKIFNEDFNYSIQIKQPDVATKAFLPWFDLSSNSTISGKYNAEPNDFSFEADFPFVSLQKYKFNKCMIKVSSKDKQLSTNIFCQRLILDDSVWVDNISAVSTSANDSVKFKLGWHDNAVVEHYKGNIPGYVAFSDKPRIKLKIESSEIIIADSTWKINSDNEVVIDSSSVKIKNLDFSSGSQRVKLEGNLSEIKEDQMYLILSSFSLANFNSALSGTGFSLHGIISGNTSFSNIYDKPILGSSIDIAALKVNKEVVGNGNISSVYNVKKDVINFKGDFKRDEVGNIKFSGKYFPSRKDSSISVAAYVNDLHLDFFEPFIKSIFQNLKGSASAQLQINGTLKHPQLTGQIKTKADNIHVNYLGTDYHFEGNIRVDTNAFDFSNLNLYDVNNNIADIVDGKIYHTNFKHFQLDFDINATKFLFLNTTEKDNTTYYGKVFATGIVNIFGFLDNINLTASVKTDKAKNSQKKTEYSQLFIPLTNPEVVGENSFVTFVKNDSSVKIKTPKYKVNTTGFTMDFKIEPTSDAQVQLIFDERVGDIMKAKGVGNIDMVINEFGDFKMYGEYKIEEGDYLFTLKKIVNKKFKIDNGSIIRWSGNPLDADINVNAVYSLRTSLSPLFPSETSDIYKKRYPVDCVMNLSGKLMSPDIKFDIKMPSVDDFIRQQALEKFKNSENDMNQQVFSLLVMNSFVTPPDLNAQQSPQQTSVVSSAGAVTTSEMLSNQLSNWLSQISKDFDVGVHYRPGDEINRDQVELALSTQLFNDKLSIDGTVANNSNTLVTQNTSNIVGDVNAIYKLTDNGKVRLKAFNQANEGDILNIQKGPYTQGVGVLYREEFDTIGELYRRFLGKTKKKKQKS